jgi:DNA-binding response OmpR family regulator
MKNILVIEDDKLISSLVQFRLKKEGYKVTMVEDGISGMDAIDLMEADLIITDVMIPYKNGIEIINHAKKVSPKVPIIVLSSLGEEENTVMEAFNLGVSDFVPKPFNPNELAVRVRRLINN